MFASRTLLMTAAVLSLGFATSAQAAGLISSTTGGVGVHTPVANVGANTNVNAGVASHDYESHSSTGIGVDGSVDTRSSERSTTRNTDGTVTTRHKSRHAANAQTDVDAGAKVYSEESVRNEQMRQDMNNNDDVHAGAGVNTRTSFGLND